MTQSKKRTWSAANLPPPDGVPLASPTGGVSVGVQQSPASSGRESAASPGGGKNGTAGGGGDDLVSVTTRKSTACPACRKQKIRCVMENDMPPCKRCAERGLLCAQNKTMQDLLRDQARWNSRMTRHFSRLQSALNETRAALSLPPVLAVDEIDTADEEAKVRETEMGEEGLDPVEGNLAPDSLASAPIRSLYEVTRVRTQEVSNGNGNGSGNGHVQSSGLVIEPDFVARGVVTLAEADQLFKSYHGRLDHFIYGHVQKYADLAQVRRTSTLLALTLCTVAALHDPLGSDVYDRLSRELRNLASSLMFRQQLGLEDVKAFCMAAYWFADMTSIVAALVVRKAIAMQYHTAHLSQPHTDEHRFQQSQMWLLIYLANEQVSILQGAPPSGVGRDFVRWETHMQSVHAGENDVRLVSHIDLLLIMSRARELYGLDTTKPIPPILVPQLRDFNMQLDRWGARWAGKLARNRALGDFPSEAVKVHWRFAKFYICSHAFRGLTISSPGSISTNAPSSPSAAPTTAPSLPPDLADIASLAVTTAISILQLLITSDELRACLVGVPHYFHTMFAFAAVFLLKVATRYRAHVAVDVPAAFVTARAVLDVFAQCPCARQHLVHRIAKGLRGMIERCEAQLAAEESAAPAAVLLGMSGGAAGEVPGLKMDLGMGSAELEGLTHEGMLPGLDLENFDFLSMPPPIWTTDFDL